ncbi:MAG: metallophosphoesterase [Christensenellales bacterium]
MKLFAISDLHLSNGGEKNMDVFGEHWSNHWGKIKSSWMQTVGEEDIVLIPGDISWAMKLEEALGELNAVGMLPGHKVILKGNHDYWWSSLHKLRSVLPEGMYALQNDSITLGDTVICGSRGWSCPGDAAFSSEDNKIYLREAQRLRMSLDSAKNAEGKKLIVMMHFPPFYEKGRESLFTETLKEYGVSHAVYGHLHGRSLKNVSEGVIDGITYYCVSCDYLNFSVRQIW